MNKPTSAQPMRLASRMGRPSVQQSQEKMEELLRIARREFVANGYRATTMDAIAAAADVSKRTLYLWHKDKAALFLACVLQGARRIPALDLDPDGELEPELGVYAAALAREYAQESSYGMGLLIIREAAEFPEVAAASAAAQTTYMLEPLAAYLRRHGLEHSGGFERTRLLIAMVLTEVHAALLSGGPPPDPALAEQQARAGVEVFLRGVRPVEDA